MTQIVNEVPMPAEACNRIAGFAANQLGDAA
jgi:hypothetical protein